MPHGPYAGRILGGMDDVKETLHVVLGHDNDSLAHIRGSEIGKCSRRIGYKLMAREQAADFNLGLRTTFAVGHFLERLVLAGMRVARFKIEAESDGQYEVRSLHPPIVGHVDGIVDLPDEGRALLEIKSANDFSFRTFTREGVIETFPDYYAQMQAYMHLADLDSALLVVAAKNTGDVSTEIVEYNVQVAQDLIVKAQRIWSLTRDQKLPDPEFPKASRACRQCPYSASCPGLVSTVKAGTITIG